MLERALEETWKNKDKFYEETKNLSMVEIIKNVENKYKNMGTTHNKSIADLRSDASSLKATRGSVG